MAEQFVKQHIVPKRYLDRFAFKKDGKSVIGVRLNTKDVPKFFTSPTDKVGYIKNFYDVTDRDDPKYWEHYFAKEFDTLCGNFFGNFIAKATMSKNKSRIITEYDKKAFGKFIVSQILRVPENISWAYKEYPSMVKEFKKDFLQSCPKEYRALFAKIIDGYSLTKDDLKELYLNRFFTDDNIDRLSILLKDKVWIVYYNTISDTMPFVTSDNPIIVYDNCNQVEGIYHVGFANKTSTFFIPLSPKVAIAIYSNLDPDTLGKIDGEICYLDEMKYICSMNLRIMGQAYKHSFLPEPLYAELTQKQQNTY